MGLSMSQIQENITYPLIIFSFLDFRDKVSQCISGCSGLEYTEICLLLPPERLD